MHITERLKKEMELYETETDKKCWAIYLGRAEMKELLEWAKTNNVFDSEDIEGRNRPQFHGALIYAVNDDAHLNVD